MTQDWITDRLPSAADADEDGDVIVMPCDAGRLYCKNWRDVKPGDAWCHMRQSQSMPQRIVGLARYNDSCIAFDQDGAAWNCAGLTWARL